MKGSTVDVSSGELTADRFRIPTPHPATPPAMNEVVAEIIDHHRYSGPVGCTFPGVVKGGTILTAVNLDSRWVGLDASKLFGERAGCDFVMLNDADAAGLAEMRHGAGKGVDGTVLLITIGTGLGTALFVDQTLVPNTELGHIELRGRDAESRAAGRIRKEKDLSWKKWAKRFNEYLNRVTALVNPDLVILGGGIAKRSDRFFGYLDHDVVVAKFLNNAGIVGAAMAVHEAAPG